MKKRDTKESILVVAVVIAALVIGSGCTSTNPFDDKPIRLDDPRHNAYYKYYVIDINSDIPDAFFDSFDEASIYQKDFAENHEYVIVKTDKEYKVYNVELIKNDTQTVQKSE